MGKTYDAIDERLAGFVRAQPVFFVATAPLSADGHINCSPKGNRDQLVVLDEHRVAYLDLTGSGVETLAHLRENGRIVIMFCAFEGPPRIVRLHGRGRGVLPGDPEFAELVERFPSNPGIRSVIVVDVTRIADSCGYAVPVMPLQSHRRTLDQWADHKGPDGLVAYRSATNRVSLDGLPGLGAP